MSELFIYNTFTRRKEQFIPREEGKVGMYVCGVTVYDYCHLGHGRCYTAFDAIRRYLEYLGYDVTHIQNITDVDDKLIRKALEEPGQADIKDKLALVAMRYSEAYFEDMRKLNILEADEYPRATDNIPGMIRLIGELVEKGYAYTIGGNVYFEVSKFSKYGQLSGRNLDDLKAGARVAVEQEKKSPLDFALWKKSDSGEPSWDSPWGAGRPGWHIECSAMSTRYLGSGFDIHGGGQDLVFPHHENERAQSEAGLGGVFVRYWAHNGFVTINQEKMSKSLGNVFNLRDIFKVYPARVVRFFFLSQHYRSPVDFSEEGLKEAATSLRRLDEGYSRGLERLGDFSSVVPDKKVMASFEQAMNDDFNTAAALAVAFQVVNRLNQKEESPALAAALIRICQVLGFELVNLYHHIPECSLKEDNSDIGPLLEENTLSKAQIGQLIQVRKKMRNDRDWIGADRIRDRLAELGIEVRDNPDGSSTVAYYDSDLRA